MVSVGVDTGVLLDRVEEVGQVGGRPDLEPNWKFPNFPQSFNIRWIVKSKIRWQMSSPPKSALSHLASKWIPFSNLTDTEVTFILSIKAWTLKVCAGLLKAGYFYHFNF